MSRARLKLQRRLDSRLRNHLGGHGSAGQPCWLTLSGSARVGEPLLGKHVVRRGERRAAVGLNGVHVEHGLAIHEGFTYYAAILAFVMVS